VKHDVPQFELDNVDQAGIHCNEYEQEIRTRLRNRRTGKSVVVTRGAYRARSEYSPYDKLCQHYPDGDPNHHRSWTLPAVKVGQIYRQHTESHADACLNDTN
jgi:hypothetical protein